MAERTINHYLFIKLADPYWDLPSKQKAEFFTRLEKDLGAAVPCANFYQVSPIKAEIDLLIWSAAPLANERDEANFFDGLSHTLNTRRKFLHPVTALWGYTRPSVYSRSPSSQEIDPFAAQRETYLVLYPFIKTIQWYLLGKDTRQGMMNEHIRIGHQYPEIKQLLLYSFGVQDQEFLVVYEMANLYRFSELVNELRGSDVREYTERDTPVYTGIWRSPADLAVLFGGTPE